MTAYTELRVVLHDNEAECEIEVRGGLEADDGTPAYDIELRLLGLRGATDPATTRRTMRVPAAQWDAFVRAVKTHAR